MPGPSFFGFTFNSRGSMFILLTVATAVFANVFLLVRRSSFGRQMAALRDSPIASQTMGMSISAAKLKIFGLSAAMAGLAGGLLGSFQARVGSLDFLYFRSLTLLLVATIFGITSVSGALLGALFFVILPEVLRHTASTGQGAGATGQALQPIIIGALAIAAARHPRASPASCATACGPCGSGSCPAPATTRTTPTPSRQSALHVVDEPTEAHVGT